MKPPGVDPSFIYHHLNVNPFVSPKKQLSRHSSREHSDAVRDEVTKLKQEGLSKRSSILNGWPILW